MNELSTDIQPNINNPTSQSTVSANTSNPKFTTSGTVLPLYSRFISPVDYDGLRSIPLCPLMNDISFIQQALQLIYKDDIRMLTHTSFRDGLTSTVSGERYNAIRYLFEERVQRKQKQLSSEQRCDDEMSTVDVNSLIALAICNIRKSE